MSDLLVKVALDESGVSSQLKGIMGKFRSAAKAMAAVTVPAAAVLGIAKSVDMLANLGEQAIRAAGDLQDTANQLGLTAERLQELRIVGKQAGVEFDQMDKALSILNKTVGEAALGQGTFEKSLASVGINLRDGSGQVKSVSQVWEELSKVVQSGALTQAQAVALAADAFGREGGKIVEVLRMTDAQQQKVIETAREYGAILSNEVVAAADEYADKLDLIQQGTAALDTQTKLVLAPLTIEWAKTKNEIAFASAELLRFFGMVDDNATLQLKRLQNLEQTAENVRMALRTAGVQNVEEHPNLTYWTKQADELRATIEAAKKAAEYDELINTPFIQTSSDSGMSVETDAQKREREKSRERLNDWYMAVEEARQAAEERDEEYYRNNLEAATQWAQDVDAARLAMQEREDQWYVERNESALAFQEAREALAARELAFQIEHEGLLTQAKREGAEARARFEEDATSRQVKTVIDGLVSMTAGVAQHSKKMFQINKLAAIGQAVMNTAQGVTKALAEYPPPLSFAMAAMQGAAGLAQIQAIRSTQFGGGGRGTTPSSAGSTPVVNDTPASSEPKQVIQIRGMNPAQLFSGRQVVDLLNAAMKDGAKLHFTE